MFADAFFRGVEQRSITIDRAHPQDPNAAALFGWGRDSSTGIAVTDEVALTYSAVFACVKVLAETLASVPLHVYERTEDGKEKATDHPLYDVLHHRANRYMSSAEFRESMMLSVGLRGNGIAQMVLDAKGNVIELWPIRADLVRPVWKDSQLFYMVSEGAGERILRAEDVLHIRGMGWGFWGLSPIDYAREAVGLGIAAEKFGAKFYASGTTLSGVITTSKPMSDPAFQRFAEGWKRYRQGLDNAHSTPILEDGMDYKPIGVTPENAQFLESRAFQVTDVCRWYRMQPHMIQDLTRSTNNNIEHQSIEFVKFTMLPHFCKWEQAIARDLFGPREAGRYFAEFSLQGLERGDMASRVAFYSGMTNTGAILPNEIRDYENLNAVEGGDKRLIPANMQAGGNGGGNNQPDQQPADDPKTRALLPIAADAARRIAARASRELATISKRHLVGGDLEGFATELAGLWRSQESRAAETLLPLALVCGAGEEGARRAAAVWTEWAGAALPAVRDAEGLATIASRWVSASDLAGAAMLASLEAV